MDIKLLGWAMALLSLSASTGAGLLSNSRSGRRVLGTLSVVSGMGAVFFGFRSLPQVHVWRVVVLLGTVGFGFLVWAALLWWKRRRKLAITPVLDYLSHAYPTNFQASVVGNFISQERKYAALLVRNTSTADLSRVVARCVLAHEGVKLPCFWSSKPGPDFEAGDDYSVDLPVDHERVLVVGQAFGTDKEWGRLPESLEHLFYPTGPSGDGSRWSPAGERLNLGREALLEVTFRARGLNQRERLRLDFDADGSRIDRLTAPKNSPTTRAD